MDKLVSQTPIIGKRSTLGYWIGGLIMLAIIAGGIAALAKYLRNEAAAPPVTPPAEETYHAHYDLRVALGNTVLDLSKPIYQSANGNVLDSAVHLHNNNGTVVHLHQPNIPLQFFFSTLGMTLASSSFTDDHDSTWQNGPEGTLRLFVNGVERTPEIETYVPQDLDRVLLIYGTRTEAEIAREQERVTDEACIYSETCPERGDPPDEECVGGLGTACEE